MKRVGIIGLPLLAQVFVLSAIAWAVPPTAFHPRPIPMGVSIGTTPSLPYIFAGTAGMRVFSLFAPEVKMILSNNHVLGTVGPTLCPNTAPGGTWVLQPGTLDIGGDPGNDPRYLVGIDLYHIPIDFGTGATNLVDAAVAFTTPALADTTILDLGGPPAQRVGIAVPGMQVSKSGRTTGVTSGTVQSVNTTVYVNYGDDCGVARFVRQAIVTPGSFSAGGDSGSVVLETATMTPVGLLFAGSSSHTVINQILFVYLLAGVFPDSN